MIFGHAIRNGTLAVLCGLVWAGCSPSGPGVADEEKEPQFLIGRSRVNSRDYSGAIEAFELALETNPQSAAAHYQLGWLYAEKGSDPAAAIYHYEQFLRRRPGAPNGEMIRKQIVGLKQTLAEALLPLGPVPGLQQQVEQLRKENRQLCMELQQLQQELAARPGPTNPPTGRLASRPGGNASAGTGTTGKLPTPMTSRSGSAGLEVRTHKVVPGDTPTSIARRYRIQVESLLAANPGLNPRRMRIDQSLTIPLR